MTAIDDTRLLAELQLLAELERSGQAEQATIRIGRFSAYTLIGLLQLCARHPQVAGDPENMALLHSVVDPLAGLFKGVLAESIEMGWDPEEDR
jgi:hypothetical protein